MEDPASNLINMIREAVNRASHENFTDSKLV